MSPRRRFLVVGGVVVLLLALSTALVVRQLTPTSAETTTAVMSLGVVGGPTTGAVSKTDNATPDTTHCNGMKPTKCTFDPGTTFNLAAYVNTIPTGGYYGIQVEIAWAAKGGGANLTYTKRTGDFVWGPREQQLNSGHSPIIVGTNQAGTPTNTVFNGAATGTSLEPTTLAGLTYVVTLTCPSTATAVNVNLVAPPGTFGGSGFQNAASGTDVIPAKPQPASLTINCGMPAGETPTPTQAPSTATPTQPAGPTSTPTSTGTPGPTATNTPVGQPTATNTPVGPTATRTNTPVPPTNTPPRPTATRTPTPAGANGDVNGDGRTNSTDAQLVLQLEAGLRSTLPNPSKADMSGDGRTNSIDALFILWREAGLA